MCMVCFMVLLLTLQQLWMEMFGTWISLVCRGIGELWGAMKLKHLPCRAITLCCPKAC